MYGDVIYLLIGSLSFCIYKSHLLSLTGERLVFIGERFYEWNKNTVHALFLVQVHN